MTPVNYLVAFLAGLASFLAPCVVPLVPAYISFISGVSFSDLTKIDNSRKYRFRVLGSSLLYIAGFSLVFVLLGLGATAIGRSLVVNRLVILRVGGAFIVLFGLYTMGLFNRWQFTQRELQIQLSPHVRRLKLLGPFLMGTTFALAWTPCVGAILGAILTLAATSANVTTGASLLLVYSLGISLPFLVIALTVSSSYKLLQRMGPKLQYISYAGGALLLLVGILMLTGKYDFVSGFILGKLSQWTFFNQLQNSF